MADRSWQQEFKALNLRRVDLAAAYSFQFSLLTVFIDEMTRQTRRRDDRRG
jgi:hypothetical protein